MEDNKEFSKLKEDLIQIMEKSAIIKGREPLYGRVLGLLTLSLDPLTQEDIQGETGYSRSQISRTLKLLEERARISKKSKPGSKTHLYEGRILVFLDNFKETFVETEKYITEMAQDTKNLLDRFNNLPESVRETREGRRYFDVITLIHAYMEVFSTSLDQILRETEEKLKELKREHIG